MRRGAHISPCGRYRYTLWRSWCEGIAGYGSLVVIGLNPSTADASNDDPTIRRCVGFARTLGCDSLVMLNLFAYRATNPKDMLAASDPVGDECDRYLKIYAMLPTTTVVAAWGANAPHERAADVAAMFPALQCWGKNKDGSPKHPLYLPRTAKLEQWP